MKRWGVCLLFLAILGCNGKKSTPVPLLEDFQSQATTEAVRSQLQQHEKILQVLEDNKSDRQNAPPFRSTRCRVEDFVSRGHQGTLLLEFFNNKLAAVSFYPSQPSTYLESMNASGIKLTNAQPKTHSSGASIELLKNYQGQSYVRWSDPVLMKAVQDWIARYS